MALAPLSIGLAAALAASGAPVAQPAESFDLASFVAAKSKVSDLRPIAGQPLPLPAPPVADDRLWQRPAKAWTMAGGGVLELGALGSPDRRIPDVVHLAFDWDF